MKYHRAIFLNIEYLSCSTKNEHFFNFTNSETNILAYSYVQFATLYFKNAGR